MSSLSSQIAKLDELYEQAKEIYKDNEKKVKILKSIKFCKNRTSAIKEESINEGVVKEVTSRLSEVENEIKNTPFKALCELAEYLQKTASETTTTTSSSHKREATNTTPSSSQKKKRITPIAVNATNNNDNDSNKSDDSNEDSNLPTTSKNTANDEDKSNESEEELSPEDEKKLRNIQRLDQLCMKLHKKIIHHEGAVNEWDDENPDYIVENVLKQRFVKTHRLLLKLMKENPHLVDIEPHEAKNLSPKKRLQFKKKLNLKISRFPELNKKVSEQVKITKEFPDFNNILEWVTQANLEHSLGISEPKLEIEAKDLFEDVTRILKKRRMDDDLKVMNSRVKTFQNEVDDVIHVWEKDPSKEDPELSTKLAESYTMGIKKEQQVMEEFTEKQKTYIEEEEEQHEGEEVNDGEDEEDDEDEEEEKEAEKRVKLSDGEGLDDDSKSLNTDAQSDDDDDEEDDESDETRTTKSDISTQVFTTQATENNENPVENLVETTEKKENDEEEEKLEPKSREPTKKLSENNKRPSSEASPSASQTSVHNGLSTKKRRISTASQKSDSSSKQISLNVLKPNPNVANTSNGDECIILD